MKLNLMIFFSYVTFIIGISSGEIFNLRCVPSRSEKGCLCNTKVDEVTSLIAREVICEYLNLQEFPNITEQDVINSLDLSHNQLTALEKHYLVPEQMELIFKLKLSYNLITKIQDEFFYNLPNLKLIDLSHNEISHLNSNLLFDTLEQLEVLDLSFNNIVTLSNGMFQNLKNLKSLNLSYNNMYEILQDPTALTEKLGITANIKELSLNNVGVTRIHTKCWNSFEKLENLFVADNPLTDIPQTQATLRRLDISGTNIKVFSENYLKYPNLEFLKMTRMENLTVLPHYAFYNLGNLEELILTDSHKFNDFNELVFGRLDKKNYLRRMKKLDLSRNNLNSLNDSYRFLLNEMEKIDLSFNPWHCGCDLLWLEEISTTLQRKSDLICASPNDVVNKLLLELKPEDVPNCYPEIYGKKFHQTALLLLTMVVFGLIVVIIYLCLYSPSWSIKISRTNVSPDSPYSLNDDQI